MTLERIVGILCIYFVENVKGIRAQSLPKPNSYKSVFHRFMAKHNAKACFVLCECDHKHIDIILAGARERQRQTEGFALWQLNAFLCSM